MFFKKKPKKTWLEQQLEFERQNNPYKEFRGIREESHDDRVDAFVNGLAAIKNYGVYISNLEAATLNASRLEVVPLDASMFMTPNEVRAKLGLKEV